MINNNKKKNAPSCADCGVTACNIMGRQFPEFCLSVKMDPELLNEAMKEYEKPEINRMAVNAAEVEADFYCRLTRIEETAEYARKMGYQKIGIATCAGLIREAGIAARVFRNKGFEVYSIACKCGTQKKVDIGIPERCADVGVMMCNPILQAKYLNSAGTDLNVVIGLCVGHDSLFYRYTEAPVTTLVVKDRVLAHNPVAALYQADKYYHRLLDEN